jgi:hypothetical protein
MMKSIIESINPEALNPTGLTVGVHIHDTFIATYAVSTST